MSDWTIYTDGACSGNPGPAGLGVVLSHAGSKQVLSEFLGDATNNIAELTAILRAVEYIQGHADNDLAELPIVIYTDSTYAIGVLSKGWKAKANQALVAEIRDALKQFKKLELKYVKGHAGDPGNEHADELARNAVQARATTAWTVA